MDFQLPRYFRAGFGGGGGGSPNHLILAVACTLFLYIKDRRRR